MNCDVFRKYFYVLIPYGWENVKGRKGGGVNSR